MKTYMKKQPKGIVNVDANLISKATYLPFTFEQGGSRTFNGEVANPYLRNNPGLGIAK